ncbi:MAG: uracil-DNA glycosylase family protein [Rhodothermaceae bacterium]|nr:uracil-DNA glycosylase family protein [Rhodothermaceae bacterium]
MGTNREDDGIEVDRIAAGVFLSKGICDERIDRQLKGISTYMKMKLEEFAATIPPELKEHSGAVFYSGRGAFETQSSVYILGLNPGGDPASQADHTVERHTQRVLQSVEKDWSEYRDEVWSEGKEAGTSGMQPRVLHLLNGLGLNPGTVPASNVVFVRSSREKDIKKDFETYAELCWPFHKKVIDSLHINTIICLGRTAGGWVREQLEVSTQIAVCVEDNKRKWRSRAYRREDGLIIIEATHPSIADWTAPATDPLPMIKKVLAT